MSEEKSKIEEQKVKDETPVKKIESKTKSVKSQPVATKTAAPEQTEQTVVYVGPSLPGEALTQFSVFKNGFPESVKVHFEKCTAIKSLMVPVSKLAAARKNLEQEGSAEYVLTQKVIKYGRGDE
ncbi:hypothetical protein [Jeotgalibacillus terrae]|uniref:Inhibitor I9 domain-containing protein n=1 Tax=Jeotgalibacillus terrae TaxID=587735 RepID=A0ABW5ZHH7_9BACL|nr:hypothetical protein [Jeotgalibacillus terrae]MBM7580010.1 hypothetical protein [Jeotgalibacillus terrae]